MAWPCSSSLWHLLSLESVFLKVWAVRNLTLNTSQPPRELDLSHLAGESRKMGDDRSILIHRRAQWDLKSKNSHHKKQKLGNQRWRLQGRPWFSERLAAWVIYPNMSGTRLRSSEDLHQGQAQITKQIWLFPGHGVPGYFLEELGRTGTDFHLWC